MKTVLYLSIIVTILFLAPAQNKAVCAAVLMGADLNDGYAGNVLDAISKYWQAPNDNVQRNIRMQIKIDGRGNFVDCITLFSADATRMDKSICDVARSIGKYGIPPYAMPAEVYLSFKTGFSQAGIISMNQIPRQVGNNNLKKSPVQSSTNLAGVGSANSSIKGSNKKISTPVLSANSSIPMQKDESLAIQNNANEEISNEISYDDWDAFGESLYNDMGSPDKSNRDRYAQAGNAAAGYTQTDNNETANIPVGNILIGNGTDVNVIAETAQAEIAQVEPAITRNRSAYTVANRPPTGGRIVDGVWVAAGQAGNSGVVNVIPPRQEKLNSGLIHSNQSANAPENISSRQLANAPETVNSMPTDQVQSANAPEIIGSKPLESPPKNVSSRQLTAPSKNVASNQLSEEKMALDADTLYTRAVMQKAAPYIRVPNSMNKGKHAVEMLIDISRNGAVEQVNVKKISGTHYIDESVIFAIKNIKDMPIPPNSKPIRVSMTFIVEKV